MKKLVLVFVAIVLVASFLTAAGAGEVRSNLISEQELLEIEAIAQKAYPKGAKVRLDVLGDDWLGACVTVQFSTGNDLQLIILEIYPLISYARVAGAGSEKIDKMSGRIVAERVGEIFNRRPAQVVERLF